MRRYTRINTRINTTIPRLCTNNFLRQRNRFFSSYFPFDHKKSLVDSVDLAYKSMYNSYKPKIELKKLEISHYEEIKEKMVRYIKPVNLGIIGSTLNLSVLIGWAETANFFQHFQISLGLVCIYSAYNYISRIRATYKIQELEKDIIDQQETYEKNILNEVQIIEKIKSVQLGSYFFENKVRAIYLLDHLDSFLPKTFERLIIRADMLYDCEQYELAKKYYEKAFSFGKYASIYKYTQCLKELKDVGYFRKIEKLTDNVQMDGSQQMYRDISLIYESDRKQFSKGHFYSFFRAISNQPIIFSYIKREKGWYDLCLPKTE